MSTYKEEVDDEATEDGETIDLASEDLLEELKKKSNKEILQYLLELIKEFQPTLEKCLNTLQNNWEKHPTLRSEVENEQMYWRNIDQVLKDQKALWAESDANLLTFDSLAEWVYNVLGLKKDAEETIANYSEKPSS